jgi:hypothetical protein
MPPVTIRIAAGLLALLFLWAALSKIVRRAAWTSALEGYGLEGSLRSAATVGVPASEIGVATLMLVGATRAGAAASVALLALFSLAVFRARSVRGDVLPCGCFGRTEARDYRTILLRNFVMGGLAAVVLAGGRDVSVLDGARAPAVDELLPAALAAAGVLLIGWIVWEGVAARKSGRS